VGNLRVVVSPLNIFSSSKLSQKASLLIHLRSSYVLVRIAFLNFTFFVFLWQNLQATSVMGHLMNIAFYSSVR
jgi:hypothetical protein